MQRFLIVDDTQFMRKMAADSLRQYRYEVAGEAVNGREAIEQYKQLRPDAVLMDLTMPEMNGLDAIKRILELDAAAVILVCSSSNQKEMIQEALEAGAKGYLTKPFQPEKMDEVIRKYALPFIIRKDVEEAAVDENEAAIQEQEDEAALDPVDAQQMEANVNGENKEERKGMESTSFVMSYLCSWKEEVDGAPGSYSVTCTDQEGKIVLEWIGSNQERHRIPLSIHSFQQLARWLDQQVLVRKAM